MRLDLPGAPHLTYCTNIHPGESWQEVRRNLRNHLPEVRRRVCSDRPMGVGLRLSGRAADELLAEGALEDFQGFLSESGLYVFTVNAFPYGTFHGQLVKERVYEPDWSRPERLRYTDSAAEILASILPDGMSGSVSTVPCAYRRGADSANWRRCAEAIVHHAATLVRIERRTGKRIVLALEPEPGCLLEKTGDALFFFEEFLFSPASLETLARLARTDSKISERLLRRHIGVCYDVCHAAVIFENARHGLSSLRGAGIEVAKIQLSSALRALDPGPAAREMLRSFDNGIYLHQACWKRNGEVISYRDLPDAFEDLSAGGGEWRVHCHVPLFASGFGDLKSTREMTTDVIGLCREKAVTPHLEIETYTWDVLPPELRGVNIDEDIGREIRWAMRHLDPGKHRSLRPSGICGN